MLHISICDDERIAVEKMQRIVENVLEQEHLLVKLETFENGEEFLKQYVIRDVGSRNPSIRFRPK